MLLSLFGPRRVTRGIALALLLLAASPLTAPFSTVDLGPLGAAAPALDSAKAKTSNDDALAAPLIKATAFARERLVSGSVLPAPPRHPLAAQHSILRL